MVEVEVNIHNTALLLIPIYFYIVLRITQWSDPNASLIGMDVAFIQSKVWLNMLTEQGVEELPTPSESAPRWSSALGLVQMIWQWECNGSKWSKIVSIRRELSQGSRHTIAQCDSIYDGYRPAEKKINSSRKQSNKLTATRRV